MASRWRTRHRDCVEHGGRTAPHVAIERAYTVQCCCQRTQLDLVVEGVKLRHLPRGETATGCAHCVCRVRGSRPRAWRSHRPLAAGLGAGSRAPESSATSVLGSGGVERDSHRIRSLRPLFPSRGSHSQSALCSQNTNGFPQRESCKESREQRTSPKKLLQEKKRKKVIFMTPSLFSFERTSSYLTRPVFCM